MGIPVSGRTTLFNFNIFPTFSVCGGFAPFHGLMHSGKSQMGKILLVIDGTPGTVGLYQ